jgi:hypothetical protein
VCSSHVPLPLFCLANCVVFGLLRAPVWTAFVTHHISSPAWLRWSDPKTLYVRELRRAIFSAEYAPPRTQRGEHILKFASRSGRLAPKSLAHIHTGDVSSIHELWFAISTNRLTAQMQKVFLMSLRNSKVLAELFLPSAPIRHFFILLFCFFFNSFLSFSPLSFPLYNGSVPYTKPKS